MNHTGQYYGRRSEKKGYDWIVHLSDAGCFVTDPVEDWEKDDDYRDEAQSNPALYDKLEIEEARKILVRWGRSLHSEGFSQINGLENH